MDTIAKIVYDKLASGGGIHLPEIGWLYVERDAARFISAREIRPPHNRVVFSRRPNPLLESVVDILARADGMTPERAGEQYSRWLDKAQGERGFVEINGVGVIKNNFFYPSVELNDRLNPFGNKNTPLKRRGNEKAIMIASAVALLAVIVILVFAFAGKGEKREKKPRERTEQASAAPSAGSESVREAVAGERAAQRGETQQQAAKSESNTRPQGTSAPKPAATPSTKPAAQPQQTVTTYHVIVGIFDTQRNADKCVSEDPVKIGRANYRIYPYRGDRLMVSAYESTDKAAAEARQRELKKYKPDAWVYTRKQ